MRTKNVPMIEPMMLTAPSISGKKTNTRFGEPPAVL